MLPLKDTLPGTRAWLSVVLTVAVVAAGAVRPLVAVVCGIAVLVAADGVARRTRPVLALGVAVLGAAAAVGVAVATGDPAAAWNPVGPLAAIGAAAALGLVHLAISPHARVLTFSLVPAAAGMIAVPVVLWTVVGGVLLVVVGR